MVEAQHQGVSTTMMENPTRVVKFKIKEPRSVTWTPETKDNEGLGLKKSKGNLVSDLPNSLLHFQEAFG